MMISEPITDIWTEYWAFLFQKLTMVFVPNTDNQILINKPNNALGDFPDFPDFCFQLFKTFRKTTFQKLRKSFWWSI